MNRETNMQSQECHRCHIRADTAKILPLWDGHSYCEACLKDYSRALHAAAFSGVELKETMPFNWWAVLGHSFLFFWLSATLTFGNLLFWFAFRKGGWGEAFETVAVAQLFFVPFCVLYGLANTWGCNLGRPTVSVSNGRITIRLGKWRTEYVDLSKVDWFLGSCWQTYFGGQRLYPRAPALLLAFSSDRHQEYRASVGFTEESRQLWIDFLTFINLPRRTAYEHRFAGKWVANVVGVIMLFLGPFAWIRLVQTCQSVFNVLFHDPKLGQNIIVSLCVFGAILAFFYVAALWPWNAHPRGPLRRKCDGQNKQLRALRWGFMSTFGGLTALLTLANNGADWISRIVALLFLWAILGFGCEFLVQRMATTEPIRRIDDELASGVRNGDSL